MSESAPSPSAWTGAGSYIRAHRDRAGLTQVQLVERLRAAGWTGSQGLLSSYERGEIRNISHETLTVIAAALGLTLDALLTAPAGQADGEAA